MLYDILAKERTVTRKNSNNTWLSLLFVNALTVDPMELFHKLKNATMNDRFRRLWALCNDAMRCIDDVDVGLTVATKLTVAVKNHWLNCEHRYPEEVDFPVQFAMEKNEYPDFFEWGTAIEEVTEDRIRSELINIIRIVMNDVIADVNALFDQGLKVDLRETDVNGRVINYFILCDVIILQNGLSSMFSTPNGIKEKCKFLKQYLEPGALRDAVDTHRRLVDSSSKTDEQALYQLVKDKVLEQEKVFRLLAKRKQHPGEGSGKSLRESNRGQRTGANQGKTARVVRNDTGKHRNVVHWLSQCPDLDEASIEHIEGINNVWADLISRWEGKPLLTSRIYSTKRITRSSAAVKVGNSRVWYIFYVHLITMVLSGQPSTKSVAYKLCMKCRRMQHWMRMNFGDWGTGFGFLAKHVI
ncbi:Hypothetical protein PHPALM_11701 [Phytophthora palmivora]|uniref:Uncharacterized protein n=1 Tax=Phytophthora palmivora TaxID=4796 RepID=A0A2P4Y1M9_9STRA|nr:Hypothetical protein PHPALM_11701 [Phytophthora palmivora]